MTEPPKSAEEATALKFSVVFCEILLAATTSDKQDAMMAIVMPLLVALLNETSSDANVLTVHNAALDTLNKVRGFGSHGATRGLFTPRGVF